MEKEFIPYQEALALKELGFDKPCFGAFIGKEFKFFDFSNDLNGYVNDKNLIIGALTYSQAFRWFREKFGMCIVIKPIDDKNLELGYNLLKNGLMMGSHPTYEEAELACLQKLIEILQNLIVIVKSR